jgi:hypothetical protein
MHEERKVFKVFPKENQKSNNLWWQWFVYYRKREQRGKPIIKDGIELNNSHVVPYNIELLLRYNAHINIKICCQSMLIKYLLKYVSKRSDRCRMSVEKDNNDEIKTYLNCRFIYPYKVVWSCLQFLFIQNLLLSSSFKFIYRNTRTLSF